MDSMWLSVLLLALVGAFVVLAVYSLRTRDANTAHATPELKYVIGDAPGGSSADSEEWMRARGQLPKL